MKKGLLLLLLACLPLCVFSQETSYPSFNHQVITNPFISNWFVEAGADWNSFRSDQEQGLSYDKGLFRSDRGLFGLDLAVGKWITPTFALRFKASGARAKCVYDNGVGTDFPSYKMWTYELQPIFNLTHFFTGYKERLWNLSVYVGMGIAKSYEENGCRSWLGTVGLLNTFNVSRSVYVKVDISASAAEAGMDGHVAAVPSGKMMKDRDRIVRMGVGIGVYLGKSSWKKAPDMGAVQSINQAEVDALNMVIQELETENARLRGLQEGTETECEIPEAPEVDM